ncbi:hypothetical protein ACF2G4_19920 (plasmid) [Pantoea sp. C3]|uniref:hypothetical protein n=1 Tax=Pantoea phytostimulans TaxID=2769024 RepID=UPI0038F688E5
MRHVLPLNRSDQPLIRVIPSGEYALFSTNAQRFWWQPWQVSLQSNRTGYRPTGETIIQLCDANTAGGYLRIACVIEEDRWRLGRSSRVITNSRM